MQGISVLRLVAVGFLMSSGLGFAQTGATTDQPLPSRSAEEAALAACEGGPIQGGEHVQPTPERDKCLAEHLRRNGPQQSNANPSPPQHGPVAKGSRPEPGAAEQTDGY